ncbi:sensory protein TspO [Rhodothalassium salexigens]|uniref:tryptophan-rich sensory protein n=1 Tax=Rhodothalassium salexigens TaxID=1086 RepID=UPI0019119501|nr:sensory protein TspO [Rhodothalassium salexigens]MBK5920003.1 sensory protein TspO [Rhodothalassium salexigens]
MTGILTFGAFLGACFAAATTGAVFKPGQWYRTLDKPSWTPPDWLFPVAWSILYVTIAASGWLILRTAGWPAAAPALAVYGAQLVANAAWSPLFFGLKRIDWGLAGVVVLWLSIVATIAMFYPLNATAAWLLLPYLGWATFAGALNFDIWRRNRKGRAGLASSTT